MTCRRQSAHLHSVCSYGFLLWIGCQSFLIQLPIQQLNDAPWLLQLPVPSHFTIIQIIGTPTSCCGIPNVRTVKLQDFFHNCSRYSKGYPAALAFQGTPDAPDMCARIGPGLDRLNILSLPIVVVGVLGIPDMKLWLMMVSGGYLYNGYKPSRSYWSGMPLSRGHTRSAEKHTMCCCPSLP